jgi:hypothetical protein
MFVFFLCVLQFKKKKDMIGSLIGAGVGLISNLVGNYQAKKQAEKAKAAAEEGFKEQNRLADIQYANQAKVDYVNRADSQAVINQAKEYAKEQGKQAEAKSAVLGLTGSQVAAQKEAGQKMVGDAYRSIAQNAQQYKDAAENRYYDTKQNISANKQKFLVDHYNQRAQANAQAGQNVANLFTQAGAAIDEYRLDKSRSGNR